MKTKIILFSLVTGLFTLAATHAFAQDTLKQEQRLERQAAQDKEKSDKQRLRNASDLKRATRSDAKIAKANSKKADRIEKDASHAAKEAKQSARMENKAQRNRMQADKQARKATKAMEKSDNN